MKFCREPFTAVLLLGMIVSCSGEVRSDRGASAAEDATSLTADILIDKAARAHGTGNLDNAILEFDFRGDRFVARRDDGLFSYERIYRDSAAAIRDVVNNDEIFREINGQRVEISRRTQSSILSRVNSTIYFASLPYALHDPAVESAYLGPGKFNGVDYDKIEINFKQEGGGPAHRDRFVYWISRDTDLIDYFAYYYHEDEPGSRLRKLVNPRDVGGFRAVDHLNYGASPDTLGSRIELYDRLIESGALELVSEVKHKNVSLVPL